MNWTQRLIALPHVIIVIPLIIVGYGAFWIWFGLRAGKEAGEAVYEWADRE